MATFLIVLGALGGATAFLAFIAVIVKSIFRQVSATDNNTAALKALAEKLDEIGEQMIDHRVRISRLEERYPGRGNR